MTIAIDGPAGVGKSSVARKCAATFSLVYINSGLLYRIIALQTLRNPSGADDEDERSILDRARIANPSTLRDLYLRHTADRQLYAQCYSAAVEDYVGMVSTILEVRAIVNKTIILLEQGNDCIVEGRDIASVVHRDAELKIYLDAKIEIRAQRRARQHATNYDTILQNIKERDTIDYQKETGQLTISKDAHIIDTTYLTFSDVCSIVSQHIVQLLCQKKS